MVPAAVLSVLVKTQGAAAAATELRGIDSAGRSASRTLDKTSTAAKNHARVLGGLGSAAKTAGLFMGGLGLAEGIKAATREYREAQKTGAQTNAVLKSTGNAANITKKGVESLANAISRKAGIDDEAIQSAENLLLTFTKIRNETGKGNDIFNQATQAVTDMSVAMNQSGKASAIQLGKALQDPVKGATALRRVGVLLTTQQQDQIKAFVKTGNTLAAQKIILRELTKEFGGSAAAQATAGDKLGVALGNLAEAAGRVLVPVMDKLAVVVTKFTNQMLDGTGAGGRFVKTMQNIWTSLQPLISALKTVVSFLARHPQLLAVAAGAWVAYKVAALAAIAATKLALLGLFGPSTRVRMVKSAETAGWSTGKQFAVSVGLAAAAGIGGFEIGKWLRANVPAVKSAGDFIGNALGKAVYDKGFAWVRRLALGMVSPLALAVKGARELFGGGGSPGIKNPATKKLVNRVGGSLRGAPRTPKVPTTTPKRPAHGTSIRAGAASVGGPMAHAAQHFSKSQLMTLWVQAGGSRATANTAAAIALAESGGESTARNSIGATGLWQIYNGANTSLGLKDPVANARAAVAKWKAAGGFSPWTTYTGADTGPGGGPGPKTYVNFLGGGGSVGAGVKSMGKASKPNNVFHAPVITQADILGYMQSRIDHFDLMVQAGLLSATKAVLAKRKAIKATLGTGSLKGDNRLQALIALRALPLPTQLTPAQKTWGTLGSGGGLDQLASAAGIAPKGMAVDRTINNPWLQAVLTHIDNLVGAGQLTQAQGNALKIGHLQNALPQLTGENALIAQGMINQLSAPSDGTDPNQALIDSNQALIDADTAAAAAAREQTDALNALNDELKKNNEFAQSVTATQLGSTMRALADFINGQIYGNYNNRSSSASSGQVARY